MSRTRNFRGLQTEVVTGTAGCESKRRARGTGQVSDLERVLAMPNPDSHEEIPSMETVDWNVMLRGQSSASSKINAMLPVYPLLPSPSRP